MSNQVVGRGQDGRWIEVVFVDDAGLEHDSRHSHAAGEDPQAQVRLNHGKEDSKEDWALSDRSSD